MKANQKGFANSLILVVAIAVIVLGGLYLIINMVYPVSDDQNITPAPTTIISSKKDVEAVSTDLDKINVDRLDKDLDSKDLDPNSL